MRAFKYFLGPNTEMASLIEVGATCTICSTIGPVFPLKHTIGPNLNPEIRETGLGCFDCLRKGRFEFWHDTEIGLLDENGLMHVYNHNQSPPPDFPASALVELRRTPQIITCQQEIWLTHCNDFMAYIGTWEPNDFYANAPDGDGRALFLEMTDRDYAQLWDNASLPESDRLEHWYATYYAFRCLHCGKLRGNWDFD